MIVRISYTIFVYICKRLFIFIVVIFMESIITSLIRSHTYTNPITITTFLKAIIGEQDGSDIYAEDVVMKDDNMLLELLDELRQYERSCYANHNYHMTNTIMLIQWLILDTIITNNNIRTPLKYTTSTDIVLAIFKNIVFETIANTYKQPPPLITLFDQFTANIALRTSLSEQCIGHIFIYTRIIYTDSMRYSNHLSMSEIIWAHYSIYMKCKPKYDTNVALKNMLLTSDIRYLQHDYLNKLFTTMNTFTDYEDRTCICARILDNDYYYLIDDLKYTTNDKCIRDMFEYYALRNDLRFLKYMINTKQYENIKSCTEQVFTSLQMYRLIHNFLNDDDNVGYSNYAIKINNDMIATM